MRRRGGGREEEGRRGRGGGEKVSLGDSVSGSKGGVGEEGGEL